MASRVCRYSLPSQQHFYMETQNALAEVGEGGTVTVHSSTQTLDGVQQAVARALGIKAHAVTVGVYRTPNSSRIASCLHDISEGIAPNLQCMTAFYHVRW